jgi:HPr kinase/phosphorylase
VSPPALTRHASCVALNGRALLILGASGQGKSALALHMMALGAGLIADDQTCLMPDGDAVIASAPASLPPLIEARGIGLLHVDLHPPAPLAGVVDLDLAPPARLPPPGTCDILGRRIPLIPGQVGPHLAPALLQFLKTGLAAVP